MSQVLTENHVKLIQGKNFANIATIREDGGPQVTPVWIDWDGTHISFNTEKKRAKTKNLSSDPRIALSISNSENPYHYIEIRGRVVEMTEEGAADQIDRLAKKYMGLDKYPFHRPGDVRVTVRIAAEKVSGMGG